MHACRHADSDQRVQTCTPKAQSSKTDMFATFYTLFLTSGRSDHTNYATVFTQHTLGQFWSQFLQFPNGCSVLHSNDLRFPSLMPPERSFETKFVVGAVRRRLDPVVHLQSPSWSLSSGDSSECFGESSVPAGFLPQMDTDKQEQQIAQAGETQVTMHTLAAGQQTIPTNVFTTECRRIQDLTLPCSDI